MYDHRIKIEVGEAYVSLFHDNYPTRPSTRALAKKAKVDKGYAKNVIEELVETETLMDPEILKQIRVDERLPTFHLSVEEEIFLLSLHTELPSRPNASYTRHL
jgi:hypothetical protein